MNIETGRKPIEERLGRPYAPAQGVDVAAPLPTLPQVHHVEQAVEPILPLGPIAGLIESLNKNAASLQGVMDTAHCVNPDRMEAGALRLFTANPDLSLSVLNSLNDLVENISTVRAKILLAQKD